MNTTTGQPPAGFSSLESQGRCADDARIPYHTLPLAPVVLASSEAPDESAISATIYKARELHAPVLLLDLVTRVRSDASSWIEQVWARLVEQGVSVSAQIIFTQEPESALNEISQAVGAPCVIKGRYALDSLEL